MQVSSNPALSLRESSDFSVLQFSEVDDEIEDVFSSKLNINEEKIDEKPAAEVENDGEEEEFSFLCMNPDRSPISADDIFQDGQIRPFYPLFDSDLRGRLENTFAEVRDGDCASSVSSTDSEEPEGPYCRWTKKSVEDSGKACRKSNSTGFSKLRRFRDMILRSKSDGKNAFVFFNCDEKGRGKPDDPVIAAANAGNPAERSGGAAEGEKNGKRPPPKSAHERLYVRNRATKEELKWKSYLPYRVGFFTRNVHSY